MTYTSVFKEKLFAGQVMLVTVGGDCVFAQPGGQLHQRHDLAGGWRAAPSARRLGGDCRTRSGAQPGGDCAV